MQLDGALDQDLHRKLVLHLGQCPRCRAYQEELSSLLAVIPPSEKIAPSPYFFLKVKRRIETHEREKTPFLMGLKWAATVAAGMILAVALWTGNFLGSNLLSTVSQSLSVETEVVSALGLSIFDDSPEGSLMATYNEIRG
jgi:predicted anti-sigma-YlaC factor YlaD